MDPGLEWSDCWPRNKLTLASRCFLCSASILHVYCEILFFVSLAATDFTVTQERSEVMTFAEPITEIYHSMFIKNPAGRPNYTAYSEPFHYMSWVAVGILVLITPPFLFFAARQVYFFFFFILSSLIYFRSRYGPYEIHRKEFTLAKSYVYTASMLTFARPWDIAPSSTRARIAYCRCVRTYLYGVFVYVYVQYLNLLFDCFYLASYSAAHLSFGTGKPC